MKPMRKYLSGALKFAVAIGLIWFLFHKGLFDLSAFHDLLQLGPASLLMLITGLSILFSNHRWLLLLKSRSFPATIKSTLPVSLIGMFFNFALPGSIGGDVVKAFYIAQDYPKRKVDAVTSVIVDRVMGLYVMVGMALIPILWNWNFVMSNLQLRSVSVLTLVLFGFMSLFFAAVFSRRVRSWKLFDHHLVNFPGGASLIKIYDAFHQYKDDKWVLFNVILLSIGAQGTATLFMYVVGQTLHEQASLSTYLFAVPLGFIVSSVPISPAGIGVGQVAFLVLFQMYSGEKSILGQTAITAFQLSQMGWSILGAVFYLLRKKPAALSAESA